MITIGILTTLCVASTFAALADIEINAALLADNHAQDALFEQFQVEFEKVYESEKHLSIRKKIFKRNLNVMHEKNQAAAARGSSLKFGVGPWADLDAKEFKNTVLMKHGKKTVSYEESIQQRDAHGQEERLASNPTVLDYRTKGLVTRVKNQGQCGSCWAFSATEEIESKYLQTGKGNVNTLALAPQQIVDCDGTSAGCGGGRTESAYNYVMSAGGMVANTTIPYQAVDGQCPSGKINAQTIVVDITGFTYATSWFDEAKLENSLVSSGGPISVCVDAANWQHYQSGVMDRYECGVINMLDHCVQLVGYNRAGNDPYWMVRNSWTEQWGIKGYIHVSTGWNACGITNDATIVAIKP